MPPEKPTTPQLVRQLIEREGSRSESPEAGAIAVHKACERMYVDLSQWVGNDGCYALFNRALKSMVATYPVLATVVVDGVPPRHLKRTNEGIEKYGSAATAEGLEALLGAVIELLTRLIGQGLAAKLIERSLSTGAASVSSKKTEEGAP